MLLRLLIFCICSSLVAAAHARTIRIEVDGSGDYPTIQEGMNAAAQWDTLLIGPGTYTWTNQNTEQWPAETLYRGMIQFLNESAKNDPRAGTANDIFLIGAGRHLTYIDGERMGRVFYASGRQTGNNNVDMRFTIESLTIQNGYAFDAERPTNRWGGGAATHLSAPTFRDVRFRWNEGQDSAGAAWTGGQNKALYENCVFIENTAPYGAGVLVVNTTRNMSIWRNCRFESNVAANSGGGMYVVNASVTLEGCTFIFNEAKNQASAIATNIANPLIVRDSFFVENRGINVDASTFWAYYWEPPDYEGDPLPGSSDVQISHSLFASNAGSGILFDANVDASVDCTVSSGHDTGNWVSFALGLNNIYGNSSEDPLLCDATGTPAVRRQRRVCEHSPLFAANNPDCDRDIGSVEVGCSDCEVIVENTTSLLPAYPNPFSDTARIDFSLERSTHVRIAVYDMKGRLVKTLHDGQASAGAQAAFWDGSDESGRSVASGVYLCEFESSEISSRTPLLLIR